MSRRLTAMQRAFVGNYGLVACRWELAKTCSNTPSTASIIVVAEGTVTPLTSGEPSRARQRLATL
jgi:hypothetical protein